jgi:hypothetical protein
MLVLLNQLSLHELWIVMVVNWNLVIIKMNHFYMDDEDFHRILKVYLMEDVLMV